MCNEKSFDELKQKKGFIVYRTVTMTTVRMMYSVQFTEVNNETLVVRQDKYLMGHSVGEELSRIN